MPGAILFIDGENFLHKIKEVLDKEGKDTDLAEINLLGIIKNPLKGLTYTTNRTILFRNPEVLKACQKKTKYKK